MEGDGSAAPPSMVDWDLAQRVATGALVLKPAPATYRSADLQAHFDELTARAELLVSEATGLHSSQGLARAKVTDRPEWAAANVRSMQRLVGPALANIQENRPGKKAGKTTLAAGRAMSGTQLGLLLAYMSTRVLGQYDLLIHDENPEDQDLVYYVGPNVVAMEERYEFVPSQFRLWLALHEVTHRMQFTAVPVATRSLRGPGGRVVGAPAHRPVRAVGNDPAGLRRSPGRSQPAGGVRGHRGTGNP